MQVLNTKACAWYMKKASEQMWSYRTLGCNIDSQYYECLLRSQHKEKVETEMKSLTYPLEQEKLEFIRIQV